jgi:CRP-like cAMP-binding protein
MPAMPAPPFPDTPLFDGLDDRQRAAVSEGMSSVILAANQTLFAQGDRAERFYVLVDGRLKVTQVTEDGRQIIVRIVHPGELCGFAPALNRDTYPGHAEAMVPSRLFGWPCRRWEAVVGAAPSLTFSAIRAIGRILDEAHTRLREASTEEAGPRIAHVLLRIARETGEAEGGTIRIPFPLTRQDVADLSGNTLHTVSRIMAAWEARGILVRARRQVIIADLAAFEAIAAG